jgi:hypothetical protein
MAIKQIAHIEHSFANRYKTEEPEPGIDAPFDEPMVLQSG